MEDAPTWVDRTAYPFTSRYLNVDGGRMHYVDEGSGEPILFVHGTPTWSFLYRHMIRALTPTYRCIAADNIGFGLSAKPIDWGYSFADHTRNLSQLIDRLSLGRFTLFVHDLGGPIGLAFALAHPERISRLIIANTTLWPLAGAFAPPAAAKLFGTALGRFLYLQMNVSPRTLLPLVYGDRSKLTPDIHRQYLSPFPSAAERHGLYAFAREMAAGAPTLEALWAQRERIAQIPSLLIWGMKDVAFGPNYLARWRELLPHAQVLELPEAGHLVQEEAPEQVLGAMRSFIGARAVAV